MSIFHYLQLQPVDPHDDGTVSDLDIFDQDEVIDLEEDIDEQKLDAFWEAALKDSEKDKDKITFSKE